MYRTSIYVHTYKKNEYGKIWIYSISSIFSNNQENVQDTVWKYSTTNRMIFPLKFREVNICKRKLKNFREINSLL